jgi:hypothetical protein
MVGLDALADEDESGERGAPADAVAAVDGDVLASSQVLAEGRGERAAGGLIGDVPVRVRSR